MVTQAADAVGFKPTGSVAAFADRWIYVGVAALYFVFVLIGFIPDSFTMLAAVEAGARPALPPVLHFHAVMMGTWILLLLVQSILMATGNRRLHMTLGMASVAVAPLVVMSMVAVAISNLAMLATVTPDVFPVDVLSGRKFSSSNLLLEQIRLVIVFGVTVTWALLVRKEQPETHKRLIFFATLMVMPAAFNRIPWMPTTLPDSPFSNHLLLLLFLSPLLIYDVVRRGRVHHAYLIGIAIWLPFVVASYFVWGTDWWLGVAPRIFGIQNW